MLRVFRTPICWLGVTIAPPVPITLPLENFSRPESTAPDVVVITSAKATWSLCIALGWTATDSCWNRSFQIDTLATPGTCSRAARMVQ